MIQIEISLNDKCQNYVKEILSSRNKLQISEFINRLVFYYQKTFGLGAYQIIRTNSGTLLSITRSIVDNNHRLLLIGFKTDFTKDGVEYKQQIVAVVYNTEVLEKALVKMLFAIKSIERPKHESKPSNCEH